MAAANKGRERVVELLIRHGAEVNLQSSGGHTALMLAGRGGAAGGAPVAGQFLSFCAAEIYITDPLVKKKWRAPYTKPRAREVTGVRSMCGARYYLQILLHCECPGECTPRCG